MKKFNKNLLMLLAILTVNSVTTLASENSSMVWETPAKAISTSIQGPVAMAVSTIAIVVAGLAWSFTDGGNFMGKAIRIVLGVVIAFGAVTLITGVFGGGAGALI